MHYSEKSLFSTLQHLNHHQLHIAHHTCHGKSPYTICEQRKFHKVYLVSKKTWATRIFQSLKIHYRLSTSKIAKWKLVKLLTSKTVTKAIKKNNIVL